MSKLISCILSVETVLTGIFFTMSFLAAMAFTWTVDTPPTPTLALIQAGLVLTIGFCAAGIRVIVEGQLILLAPRLHKQLTGTRRRRLIVRVSIVAVLVGLFLTFGSETYAESTDIELTVTWIAMGMVVYILCLFATDLLNTVNDK